MKGSRVRYIGLLAGSFFFILFLFSCEEEVELELNKPETQRIVVEGRITNEFRRQLIRLTRTTSYFQNELAPPVTGANVYILEEGTGIQYPLTLRNDTFGIYETQPMAGRVGETYTLFVSDHGELYEAVSYLDTVLRLDSMKFAYEFLNYFGFRFGVYNMSIYAYEPPPLGHFYKLDIFINDTLFTDELVKSVYSDDFLFNDSYLDSVIVYSIPQERIRLDTNVVRLVALSVSRDEIYFLSELMQESYGSGSVFSGPPANIRTNLKNTTGGLDGLGFFGASAKSVVEALLIKVHDESTNNPFFVVD